MPASESGGPAGGTASGSEVPAGRTPARESGVGAGANPAAVLHAPGDVRVEDRAVPEPGSAEVLVEVASVGVCGSDAHYYRDGRLGDFVVREPLVLGHEAAGVVAGTGSRVHGLESGQRVALEPGVPCRDCEQCRAGRYNLCPDVRFFATPPVDGAFQRHVTVPETFAYPVPDDLSDDAAALLEPLSVALWACRKAGVTAGTRALVTGVGPVGLLVLQVARAQGAAEVVVSDTQPNRLELARSLGATDVVDVSAGAPTGVAADVAGDVAAGGLAGSGFAPDVLLECSGSGAALEEAVHLVRPSGRVVMVGMGAAQVGLPVPVVQQRELWVTGTFRYANTWPAARALATSGAVELDGLVTGHFGLAEADQALRAVLDDPRSVKPVVHPQR